MAAGDITVFEEAKAYMLDGGWEAADSIKIALVTNSPLPAAGDAVPGMNAGATTTYTDCAAGGAYTAGGDVLDTWGNMVTQATGTMTFDDTGATVAWTATASSPTDCRWGIVYNSSDTGLERAICIVDLGATVNLVTTSLTITWDASNGIFQIT